MAWKTSGGSPCNTLPLALPMLAIITVPSHYSHSLVLATVACGLLDAPILLSLWARQEHSGALAGNAVFDP